MNFEEHKGRIDQGFPHIGVCPWLVPHLMSSFLSLFSAIYIYVLFVVYFNANVIAKYIELTLKIEINFSSIEHT